MRVIKPGEGVPNIFFINDTYIIAESIVDAVTIYKKHSECLITSIIPVIKYSREMYSTYIIINDDDCVKDDFYIFKFDVPKIITSDITYETIYYVVNEKDERHAIESFVDAIKKINDVKHTFAYSKVDFSVVKYISKVIYEPDTNELINVEKTMIKEK